MEELIKLVSTGSDVATYIIVYMLYKHDKRLTVIETIQNLRQKPRTR